MKKTRSVAWRLYFVSVMQLVLLAATVVGVGAIIRASRPPAPPHEHHTHKPPIPIAPLLTFFASGLVIVGVGTYFSARWIMQPLSEMSRAARALGDGDLKARTGIDRSDEIGDVARTFDEMADRVVRLVIAEKELLANVSHELRTPLARIRVALDLATEGDTEAMRAALADIQTDLAEVESLIGDILTASRLDLAEGRTAPSDLPLHFEDVPARSLAERAAERFRAHHPQRPFEVALDGDGAYVRADPVMFRRVLDNVLENANKYSPDPTTPIALRLAVTGERAVFEVIDHGVGIEDADLPRIFSPFFRADRSRARVTGGVGLGLTLAQRLVHAHDATIDVESAPGEGTTVYVGVPLIERRSQAK